MLVRATNRAVVRIPLGRGCAPLVSQPFHAVKNRKVEQPQLEPCGEPPTSGLHGTEEHTAVDLRTSLRRWRSPFERGLRAGRHGCDRGRCPADAAHARPAQSLIPRRQRSVASAAWRTIGRMEPLEHATVIAATCLLLGDSAVARAELAAARARYHLTLEQMHRALLEAQWPGDVPGADSPPPMARAATRAQRQGRCPAGKAARADARTTGARPRAARPS